MIEVYLYIAGFVIFGFITILAIISIYKNQSNNNSSGGW